MMAAKCGADSIVACEVSKARTGKNIFSVNKINKSDVFQFRHLNQLLNAPKG
jgi:hypothetical protein